MVSGSVDNLLQIRDIKSYQLINTINIQEYITSVCILNDIIVVGTIENIKIFGP